MTGKIGDSVAFVVPEQIASSLAPYASVVPYSNQQWSGMPGGIVLRQTMRLGGVDIRSVVTEIAEVEAPAGTFEIPAGYKEVPPPAAPH